MLVLLLAILASCRTLYELAAGQWTLACYLKPSSLPGRDPIAMKGQKKHSELRAHWIEQTLVGHSTSPAYELTLVQQGFFLKSSKLGLLAKHTQDLKPCKSSRGDRKANTVLNLCCNLWCSYTSTKSSAILKSSHSWCRTIRVARYHTLCT